jgi:hypothetical protein
MTRTNYNCCKIILFLLCTFLMGTNSQAETSREYTCALEKYVTINKNIMDWTYVKGEKFSLSIKENVAFLNDDFFKNTQIPAETLSVTVIPNEVNTAFGSLGSKIVLRLDGSTISFIYQDKLDEIHVVKAVCIDNIVLDLLDKNKK